VRRRTFIAGFAAAAAPGLLRAAHENGAAEKPVRFGLTPVFLDDHVAFLRVWRQYLESKLSRPVLFIQRGSYREISDMLRQDKLDFAWVCGYPFMRLRRQLRLLAVPLYQGKPLYQSYVIVPSFNTDARSILDLRGQVFAYSDPDSNSGFLYANYRLIELNENPASFFSKAFFTWAHRNVVDAVAAGVARGGSVDGYVWETLQRDSPELTARTRVVEKSPEFGFPPLVARATVAKAEFEAVQQALLAMAGNGEGRALLKQLNLDGFAEGTERLFDGIERMMKVVDRASDAAPA